MSNARGFVQQEGVARTTDGNLIGIRITRDGSTIAVPWVQAIIMEGLGYSAGYGSAANSATTVGTFGAGGVDLDEFDLLQTLPTNASVGVIPIYFKPVLEVIGTILATDVLLAFGSGGVISNGISVTPANLKPDSDNASVCTIGGLGDDGGTAMTVGTYIYREGGTHLTGVAGTGQTLMPEWSIASAGYAPVIVGASRQVAGFASGQASTGFITYQWLELPADAL